MNFLLLFSLGFNLCFVIILFLLTMISPSKGILNEFDVSSFFVSMLVTTRPQAKQLIGSSKKLSISSSINSSKELSTTTQQNSSQQHLLSSSKDSCKELSRSSINTSLSCLRSSFQSSTNGDSLSISSTTTFQNLEFLNFEFVFAPITTLLSTTSTSSFSHILKMEADCKDNCKDTKVSNDIAAIAQLIYYLSTQMTHQNQSIEEKIIKNEMKLSGDFQRVVQDNENFKKNAWAELDGLRMLLDCYTITSDPDRVPLRLASPLQSPSGLHDNLMPQVVSSTSSASTPVVISNSTTVDKNMDPQTKMMLMLTETFAKLSNTLSDKKEETESEWPKFSGDQKKFRTWYMAIMSQISLPPWQDLYDPTTHDVVKTTTNTQLNAKLYAKLIVSLEGSVFQSIVSHEHLQANGLLLLQNLVQT